MTKPRAMTKTEFTHWSRAVDAMRHSDFDMHAALVREGRLPEAWDEIWRLREYRDPARQRVTIRLDADVVRFFRAMGEGYQTRMNRVLRAFMHMRLAQMVEGPETAPEAIRFVRAEDAVAPPPAQPADDEPDIEAIRASIGEKLDRIRESR